MLRKFLKCLGKVALVCTAIAMMGWVVMMLWNAVLPTLFDGVHQIDYGRALGLLVLSRILFGGFRGYGGWHARRHWEKWQSMTPEEREKFSQSGWCVKSSKMDK